MSKYKINRKREPLTDADVEKGQNFDAFMKAYSAAKKPFYKTTTFKLSIAASLGLVIAVGGYVAMNPGTEATNTDAKTAFVSAPLAGINIPDTTYRMDAAEGGNFLYSSGSLIKVPEGAFMDSAGNIVKGNIEIRYREFHNPAEIFIAGIPMTYDSAGIQYHFESAGMLEITAWQNGKMLKVNPTSPITVDMASDNADNNKFNVYYLDTVKKNWDFIAKDKAQLVGFITDTTKKDSVLKTTASIPVAPRKAEKGKPNFAIKFDPNEFPELGAYKGTRFEVDETQTPYNKEDKKVKWEDVGIVRNKDGRTYSVTFTKDVLTRTYVTYAVVDDKDYDAAKKTFDKRYADYQAGLLKKQRTEIDHQLNDEKRVMTADAHRIFVNDTVLRDALSKMRRFGSGKNAGKEDMVMREFQIKNFGIWNSDCPASLPEGEQMLVKLIDAKTKKAIGVEHLYLVERNRNALFTFYDHDLIRFQFNKKADNMVWAITMEGKLATASDDGLKAMDVKTIDGKKSATLEMTVTDTNLNSVDEVKAVLGI